LQADFAGISLEIFVKTQHFSKEAGRPGKILQFQMQFATKPLDFGSWIFFLSKYTYRPFICIISRRRVRPCSPVSVFKMPKNTAKKLQSQSHFTLPPIFTIKKKSFFLSEIFKNVCL
jgi:hypothetical protein